MGIVIVLVPLTPIRKWVVSPRLVNTGLIPTTGVGPDPEFISKVIIVAVVLNPDIAAVLQVPSLVKVTGILFLKVWKGLIVIPRIIQLLVLVD